MKLKLVKYSAPWCGQCKALAKEFNIHPVSCEVQEMNVDDMDTEELDLLQIKSIPVSILWDYEDENNPIRLERWNGIVKSSVINDYINTLDNAGSK